MIKLTRLSGSSIEVNPDQITTIEDIRDQTVVELATGTRLIVSELAEVVINKVIHYRREGNGEVVPLRFEVWATAERDRDTHSPGNRPGRLRAGGAPKRREDGSVAGL